MRWKLFYPQLVWRRNSPKKLYDIFLETSNVDEKGQEEVLEEEIDNESEEEEYSEEEAAEDNDLPTDD